MTAAPALLGLLWSGFLVLTAARRRPLPARRRRALGSTRSGVHSCPFRAAMYSRQAVAVVAAVSSAAALALAPVLAPVPVAAAWFGPRWQRRRQRAQYAAAVESSLPEVVDLLALAVGAGATVPLAIAAVAGRARGPVAAELARVHAEVSRGRRLADSLDDLAPRTGAAVRPLAAALAASERYGAPIGPALERLAGDVRRRRQRQAEEAARRVPVALLFPVVVCILPAFALLTVAPLLAGAIGELRLA